MLETSINKSHCLFCCKDHEIQYLTKEKDKQIEMENYKINILCLCEYGCGNQAKYQFKNGKWCCSDNVGKCPTTKIKSGKKIRVSKKYGKKEKITIMNNEGQILCDHCGIRIAKYHFKNGGHCCENNPSKCPAIKNRIRKSVTKLTTNVTFVENSGKVCEYGCNKNAKYYLEFESSVGKWCCNDNYHKCNNIKKNRRIRMIERIKNRDGQLYPNYNPEACKLIDEYGKEHGYNFQHAENGGEYHIKELGYFVDGYDKLNNVVIEVDEPFHFDGNGNLYKRDILRQKEIENFLNCKFIRIRI